MGDKRSTSEVMGHGAHEMREPLVSHPPMSVFEGAVLSLWILFLNGKQFPHQNSYFYLPTECDA